MPEGNFSSMVAGGSVFLGLAVSLVLLRQKTLSTRLLSAAMLVSVLNILHGLWMPLHHFGNITLLTEPLQFALPPLFAAYVRSVLVADWQPRPVELGHFLPFLLMSTLTIVLNTLSLPAHFPAIVWSAGTWILLLIQAFIYIGGAVRELRHYRQSLNNEVSTLQGVDQAWLLWFSRTLHLLYLSYMLVPFVLLHAGGISPARHLIGLALCLAVGVLAVHQLMARQSPVILMSTDPSSRPRNVTADQALSPLADWSPELPPALLVAMTEKRLYRNPGLTLVGLADHLGWPRNEVSAAINGHFGQNFHDFINGFRVEETKLLMADPANRGFTLLALAMAAGFNSKATFNTVFKKTTGLTPSTWLNQHNLV